MVDEKVPLEGCPREGCDDPVLEAFRTDTPFQLRRQNMVVDKWCIVPRVDPASGDFFVYCIRHGEIEGFKTGNEVRDESDPEPEELPGTMDAMGELDEGDASEASADPNEDNPDASDGGNASDGEDTSDTSDTIDVSDLPEFERSIYEYVDGKAPVTLAGIQGGTAIRRDKSLEEVEAAVDWLAENGYIAEGDEGYVLSA